MEAIVLKQVKAARMAERMAEATAALTMDGKVWTVADEAYGQLLDSLRLCAEKSGNNIEIDKLESMLTSDMTDGEIAMQICAEIEMPKPNIVDDAKRRELAEKNGYYLHRDSDKRSDSEKIVKVYERLNKMTAMMKSCENENARMRKVIKDISEDRCKECILGHKGFCVTDDCKWYRYKGGDFS